MDAGKWQKFEKARCKTPRERGTVDIVKTNISVIGGALDELDAGDSWIDGIMTRWNGTEHGWTMSTE